MMAGCSGSFLVLLTLLVTTQGLSQVEVLTADDLFSLSLKYTRCIIRDALAKSNQWTVKRDVYLCISVSMEKSLSFI